MVGEAHSHGTTEPNNMDHAEFNSTMPFSSGLGLGSTPNPVLS